MLAFAFNHGEATRVQWTPPLRESFAFPMITAQIAVVTYILKYVTISIILYVSEKMCWIVQRQHHIYAKYFEVTPKRTFSRNQCSGALYFLAVAFFGIFAMLFWQFSQFAFFTQVGCLFVVYTFDFIPRKTMDTLLSAHLVCVFPYIRLLFHKICVYKLEFGQRYKIWYEI